MTTSTTPTRITVCALLCAGIGAALPATAQVDKEQLSRDIESVLLEQADRNALGTSDTPLTVSSPLQVRYELGAVVVAGDKGATIMAITPKSAAERLELQPGDRLIAINGVRIADAADPASTLERAVRDGGGSLKIEASRDGHAFHVDGQADVVAIPAYKLVIGAATTNGCGFVTDQAGSVPTSQDIYRADITQIDWRSTPIGPKNRHRVDTGRHVLRVRELIPGSWLSGAQLHQVARMKRIKDDDAYKTFVVDVKPGVSYRVGARLLRDKLDAENIRNNAYWEPVIWESVPERCR